MLDKKTETLFIKAIAATKAKPQRSFGADIAKVRRTSIVVPTWGDGSVGDISVRINDDDDVLDAVTRSIGRRLGRTLAGGPRDDSRSSSGTTYQATYGKPMRSGGYASLKEVWFTVPSRHKRRSSYRTTDAVHGVHGADIAKVRRTHATGAIVKGRARPAAKSPDNEAARELQMFIDNDGDLYRQQTVSIHKNLMAKRARGVYNPQLAAKAFMYLAEAGAKKYAKDLGSDTNWHNIFDVATRRLVAENLRDEFIAEAEVGNYDEYIPKKYRK